MTSATLFPQAVDNFQRGLIERIAQRQESEPPGSRPISNLLQVTHPDAARRPSGLGDGCNDRIASVCDRITKQHFKSGGLPLAISSIIGDIESILGITRS